MDENFVDRIFRFEADGSAVMISGNFAFPRELSRFPEGITRCEDSLTLDSTQLESCENFPSFIDGGLYFNGSPIKDLSGLRGKQINGKLALFDILAKKIPRGISIKDEILIVDDQTELIEDCRNKGYKVVIKTRK